MTFCGACATTTSTGSLEPVFTPRDIESIDPVLTSPVFFTIDLDLAVRAIGGDLIVHEEPEEGPPAARVAKVLPGLYFQVPSDKQMTRFAAKCRAATRFMSGELRRRDDVWADAVAVREAELRHRDAQVAREEAYLPRWAWAIIGGASGALAALLAIAGS